MAAVTSLPPWSFSHAAVKRNNVKVILDATLCACGDKMRHHQDRRRELHVHVKKKESSAKDSLG
jgi:hypothetical protein